MPPQALAHLHARCFTSPPPWSVASFAQLLQDPGVVLLAAPDDTAFALFRIVADEAELLTIATDPVARRRGQARRLIARFEPLARAHGVAKMFLEVAEDNLAALRLYEECGFSRTGRRPNYYSRANAPAVAALMLCKSLDAELT
ncbi:MAG: GNAT family N-acetyltransferase [Pararhodobacter sp.]